MGVVYRALVGSTTSIVEWRRVGGEWSPPQETILCEDVLVEIVDNPFVFNKCGALCLERDFHRDSHKLTAGEDDSKLFIAPVFGDR
jgi:hypothetical protein